MEFVDTFFQVLRLSVSRVQVVEIARHVPCDDPRNRLETLVLLTGCFVMEVTHLQCLHTIKKHRWQEHRVHFANSF